MKMIGHQLAFNHFNPRPLLPNLAPALLDNQPDLARLNPPFLALADKPPQDRPRPVSLRDRDHVDAPRGVIPVEAPPPHVVLHLLPHFALMFSGHGLPRFFLRDPTAASPHAGSLLCANPHVGLRQIIRQIEILFHFPSLSISLKFIKHMHCLINLFHQFFKTRKIPYSFCHSLKETFNIFCREISSKVRQHGKILV